ncbi:NFX1-type zinc finger-containing protein 1-like [Hemiscyllium ocellatum]|uniref:NFX1-type zinc finger-containing protein 1-like n=1 Tax=Hemiscyllium ocellatum TaxID=170820 RepID=UPI00296643F0|nr:NFX1-type zinc finger-containing protein 1-like [Hemiscyllium ocellatum]
MFNFVKGKPSAVPNMERKRQRIDVCHNGFGQPLSKMARESPRGNPAPLRGGYLRDGALDYRSFFSDLADSERQMTVVSFLLRHGETLAEVLDGMELGDQEVRLVVRTLTIAAEMASSQEETRSVLHPAVRSAFLLKSLLQSIAWLDGCGGEEVDHLLCFLRHLSLTFPESIRSRISVPADLLRSRLQRLQGPGSELSWPRKKQLQDLERLVNDAFPGGDTEGQGLFSQQEQPGDFHQLSVFPSSRDVAGAGVPSPLSPNKVEGPYLSAQAYLDNQFRLLQEDFVKPLREDLAAYLAPRSRFLQPSPGLRVYSNVQILHPVCMWEGVTYKARFEQPRRAGRPAPKRLQKGSLVCLLAPDCREIFFASVAKSDAKCLGQGLLYLRFSISHAELAKVVYGHRFTMVESRAFFEAYRHVLLTLQAIDGSQLPFQRYIVKCKPSVRPPAYLRQRGLTLDLLPLLRNLQAGLDAEMESEVEGETSPLMEPRLELGRTAEGDPSLRVEQELETEDSIDLSEETGSPEDPAMEDAEQELSPPEESDRKMEEEEDHRPMAEGSSGPAEQFISIRCQEFQTVEERPDPVLGKGTFTERGSSSALEQHSGTPTRRGGSLTRPGNTITGRGDNFTKKHTYEVDPFQQDFRSLRWLKHFDRSQLKALQKALKREFALIQGPPGTGKTFLGLKLVELLLHNRKLWQKTVGSPSPILIVCSTKHILEQFVEGMLEFKSTGIVRIGGLCKNKKLQMFSLEAIRKTTLQRILTPTQRRRFKELKEKIESIKEDIFYCSKVLKLLPLGILHEKELEPEIRRDLEEAPLEELFILKWLNIPPCLWSKNGTERRIYHRGLETEPIRYFCPCPKATSPSTEFNSRNRLHEVDDAEMEWDLDGSDSPDPPCSADQWAGEKFAYTPGVDISDPDARAIQKNLGYQSIMEEEEVWNIKDVWELDLNDRWRLYRKWRKAYQEKLQASINKHVNLYEEKTQELSELMVEEDAMLLKTADVISMTTTGAAKYRALLQKVEPRIVLVEGAAEVLEAHVVTALTPSCQHLIMIGDHKQLRPKLTDHTVASQYHLDVSLFERMIKNKIPYVRLSQQHRMRPEISQLLVPTFYPKLEDHSSVLVYEDIKGLMTNIFFVEHQVDEDESTQAGGYSNEHEAQFLVGLCHYLLQQGYGEEQLTILTPYTAQMWRIRNLVRDHDMASVSVKAIDDFQGGESDIVLLSLVRSNWEEGADLPGDKNHLCVALSRARMGFYCTGHFQRLQQGPDRKLWESLLQPLKDKALAGKGLPAPCPNHPERRVIVETPEGFWRFPGWTCSGPCGARLDCGHYCRRRCHSHRPGQRGSRCKELCVRVLCQSGHRCPKRCWEQCGPCQEMVEKVVPGCGHTQRVECGVPAAPCQQPCARLLECGHQCQQRCSEDCSKQLCPAKCTETLQCGHPCAGTCAECLQGRLHRGCRRKCGRLLLCGHLCKAPCAESCPPCPLPCDNRCWHSVCPGRCGEICEPCQQPCPWRCPHHRCGRRCSEECDRPRCSLPCERPLPCGHPCVGLCGEPCPSLCRTCHREQLGGEPGARFVLLEDCGHVLEVGALDRLMDEGPRPLRLEACPKCGTPIRWNGRYANAIKRRWRGINRVKSIVLGAAEEVEEMKKQLRDGIIAASVNQQYKEQRYSIRKKVEASQSLPGLQALGRSLCIFQFLDTVRKQVRACPLHEQLQLDILLTRVDCWLDTKVAPFTWQQLNECRSEIARISCLAVLKRLQHHWETEGGAEGRAQPLAETVAPLLRDLIGKLTEATEQRVRGAVEELTQSSPCPGELWFSGFERLMAPEDVVKQDWYQCPKGHLYAVEECGQPGDREECLECVLVMGGE